MKEVAEGMTIGAGDRGAGLTGAPAAVVRHCSREVALPPLPIPGLPPVIAARAQLELVPQFVADEGLVVDRIGLAPLVIGPRAAPTPIPAEWRPEVEAHIARLRHIVETPAEVAAIVTWVARWCRAVGGSPDPAEGAVLALLRDVPAVALTSDLAVRLAAQWRLSPVPKEMRALCEVEVRPYRDLLMVLQGWMVTATDAAATPMPPTQPHTPPPAGQEVAAAPEGALPVFETLAALSGPLQGAWLAKVEALRAGSAALRSNADAAPLAREVLR